MSRRTTVPNITVRGGSPWHGRKWRVECSDPRCGRLVGAWWSWSHAMRWANAHASAHWWEAQVVRRGVARR